MPEAAIDDDSDSDSEEDHLNDEPRELPAHQRLSHSVETGEDGLLERFRTVSL